MKVIKYNFEPELKQSFIDMNYAWISKDYVIEEEDKRVFARIDDDVRSGAIIYFVIENEIAISTLMLTPVGDSYELVKYASKEGYHNKGAGELVLKYALDDAKKFTKRIFIATNKKCLAAIHLYEKYGFKEYKAKSTFGFSSTRVDITFELFL